jgi:CheY-like chemotaxis protein
MAKILVADDELSMRQFLEILLKKEGHEVFCAGDGQEALSRFQDDPVDLVITDIKMPRMDGLDLLRKLKEQRPNLPVSWSPPTRPRKTPSRHEGRGL